MAPRQTSAALTPAIEPFVRSNEVAQIADRVISDNVAFRPLNDLSIEYLLNTKAADDGDGTIGIDSIVRAVKAPPLWRWLSDVDVVVWCNRDYWTLFDETARRALITHALSHVDVEETERGDLKIKIVGHDVEEFHRVAMQFGTWTAGVAQFAKAIAAQREGQAAEQQALDTALQQLDGTTIVDPESGTTATISTSQPKVVGDPSIDGTDVDGLCGTPITDNVVCSRPAFHDGAHEGQLVDSESGPVPAPEQAPAPRPRKGRKS